MFNVPVTVKFPPTVALPVVAELAEARAPLVVMSPIPEIVVQQVVLP